jgi:hypothetical protein
MSTLTREQRTLLENTVVAARDAAERGAQKILTSLGAGTRDTPDKLSPKDTALRNQLRAHGRQLGDKRQPNGAQETTHLKQACAYEHWHRLLFARFLAENDLLLNPEYGVAMSLAEIQETARAQNLDWLTLASDYAQRMLLEVFRPDNPVLQLVMPPENRQELEEKLGHLPTEIFTAEDSLGWVYQFWQRDEKERVNKSEVKISAEELAPVTQLFTEDYMVLFLLHNTLGAWWTAKRRAEGKDHRLPGYEWTYLRLNADGSPAAGDFDGWPKESRLLRVLDPCMGSGHFLVFVLPILARMRQEEEGSSLTNAICGVLADNLFGLELDARCSQIAAFNLALTAWRMIGRPFQLPAMNLACSGLGINASQESWIALAAQKGLAHDIMSELYTTFQKAPTLGSLIDPSQLRNGLFAADFEKTWSLILKAISKERPDEDENELAVAAKGLLLSAKILTSKYTLVATNVPYLVKAKQGNELRSYCESYSPDGSADLATVFIERCGRLCSPGGAHATVSPLNWLFIKSYTAFRKHLVKSQKFEIVATIGSGATATASWDVLRALVVVSLCTPNREMLVSGVETDADKNEGRASDLCAKPITTLSVGEILQSPNCRIALSAQQHGLRLSNYADSLQGLSTGDNPQFQGQFWEFSDFQKTWSFLQGVVAQTEFYGGRSKVVRWEQGQGSLADSDSSAIRGLQALGRSGVVVSQMRTLPTTLFSGSLFDTNVAVILPKDERHLLPIWCYCSSDEFVSNVRRLDKKLNVTNATFGHVPFDLARWQAIARDIFPNGMPAAYTDDPSQWLFDADLTKSRDPLQVAVAKLIGYRWPHQRGVMLPGSSTAEEKPLPVCDDSEGIIALSPLTGQESAAQQLRSILETAYGSNWSITKQNEILRGSPSLEDWLRDEFFDEHCALFKRRPFVWHVWDGRRDGFAALVSYHKLAGPNGEGRRTLERLIYTVLGDWISRQRAEVTSGADGAEARLSSALHLQSELENILRGAPPYDIFVRWKPIHKQAIGWDPDLNDGVLLNLRPWLMAKPYQANKKGACILRGRPVKLPFGTDRGKEPHRDKKDFPWFSETQDRNNDIHLTLDEKRKARERKKA